MKYTLLLIPIILVGCATRPVKYQPPDPSAMQASARKLGAAVQQSQVIAKDAQDAVKSAKKEAESAKTEAAQVRSQLASLFRLAPVELQPLIATAQDRVEKLAEAHETLLITLTTAEGHQTALDGKLAEAYAAKTQHSVDMEKYQGQAQKLADDASKENSKRIAAEQSLSWYRWHFWGSWIALGLGIAACIVFAFLKFTGRLAIATASTAAKL